MFRSFLLFMAVTAVSVAAPASLTQSVTRNGETITLRLTRENLRGDHFELWAQNATGSYDVITPVEERSYLGTVDEYPDAVSWGILQDDGSLKGGVIFDRGRTWSVLNGSVTGASTINQPATFGYTLSTPGPGQGGSSVYGFDVGIDARYEYYNSRGGGSLARTFEMIEHSVASTRALYIHDALLRPYLGRVIIRTDLAQDPANGLTQGSYLDALRNHWNSNQTDADRDLVAGVAPSHVWAGLAWVGVVATNSGYSVNDSNGDGDFSVVWRHEMGHNWGMGHYDGGAPEAGTINSNNHFARMSGPELQRVFSQRDARLWALDDEGPLTTVDIPPYATYDSRVFARDGSGTLSIDVLANDHDANGHALQLVDVRSSTAQGGTARVENGAVAYTPRGDFLGVDSFTYTVQDSSGQTATGAVAVDVQPNDRLRFWLALDETSGTVADDRSVFDRNGTLSGTDFAAASVAGVHGSAGNFDGIDDHVRADGVNLSSNTATLTAWINPGATPNPWSGIIFDRSSSANGLNLGNSGELRYHWNDLNWGWNSGLVPTPGVWTFVALVVEPGKATIYMNDGSGFQSAVNVTNHGVANFGNLSVGRDPSNSSRHFLGAIDEARIYQGALDPSDLQLVMDGGAVEGPSPFDGAGDLGPVDLAWVPSAAAIEYQVYLGTDATAVANATTTSAEYLGTTSSPTWQKPPTAVWTTHYWRVDTVTATGTIPGTVWSFTRNGLKNIAIVNASFEDGPSTSEPPPGWTQTTAGPLGVGDGGSDGSRFLYIGPGAELTQDLGHTLVEGETLTLRYTSSRTYARSIQLLAKTGGTYQLVAETTEATGSGSWPTITLTHTVGAAFAGQQLALRIVSSNWNEFDNFRFSTWMPEPGPSNTPPAWHADPLAGNDAVEGASYSASLAADASDDDGDLLTFEKLSGPAWLAVVDDGALLGTPGIGDIGTNTFTVRATDPSGASDDATMVIEVRPARQYYDLNGALAGSGAPSGGTWDGGAQWTGHIAGTSPSFGWSDGAIPVFSAGDDATGDLTVINSGTRRIRGFGARSGRPLITGGSLETLAPGAIFDIESTALGATIESPIAGSGGLVKTGPGTLVLGGGNTYTGDTRIAEGVLELTADAKLYNAGHNNSAVITVETGGIWRLPDYSYGGVGRISDYAQRRVLDGGVIEVTGNTHSSGLDFTVTGNGGTFRYTAPGQTLTLSGNGNTNLQLGGPLTLDTLGHVTIAGASAILEGNGSLTKTGDGDLTLANPGNRFTGDLTVKDGRLLATASAEATNSTLGAKSPARSITIHTPGTMEWTRNDILGGGGMDAAGLPAIVLDGSTLTTTRYNPIGHLTLAGASLVNANATDPLAYDGFQFIGKVTVSGETPSFITTATGRGNHLLGGGTTEFQIIDPAGRLEIETTLRDGSGNYPGAAALRKTGAGTLRLKAAKLYTGSTTVEEGRLELDGSLAGPLTLANAATLVTAGGISIAGDLDLGTASVIVNATPVSSPHILLTFTGTRSGAFDEASSTLPAGWQVVYDDTTGEIRLESTTAAYAAWIDTFATDGLAGFDEDADFDGIANGLEFVLGGNPTLANDSPAPTLVSNPSGGFTYSFRRDARARGNAAVVLQQSDNLTTWPAEREIPLDPPPPSGVRITNHGDHDIVEIDIPDIDPRTFLRLSVQLP